MNFHIKDQLEFVFCYKRWHVKKVYYRGPLGWNLDCTFFITEACKGHAKYGKFCFSKCKSIVSRNLKVCRSGLHNLHTCNASCIHISGCVTQVKACSDFWVIIKKIRPWQTTLTTSTTTNVFFLDMQFNLQL